MKPGRASASEPIFSPQLMRIPELAPLVLGIGLALPLPPAAGASNEAGWVAAEPVGRVLMVKAAVNGQAPVPMILDTGATETILTWDAALRLGLVRHKAGGIFGPVLLRTFGAGSAVRTNMSVLVMDPPQALPLRLNHGADYQGLIGYTFLKNCITTIDYRQNRVRFELSPVSLAIHFMPRNKPPPLPGFNLPLQLCDRLLYAPGTVNGQGPLTFLIDTGSAEVVLLPRVAEKLRLDNLQPATEPNVRWTYVKAVALGAAVVSNVAVVVCDLPRDDPSSPPYDGILGQPFLSKFLVTVDYPAQRLGLKP